MRPRASRRSARGAILRGLAIVAFAAIVAPMGGCLQILGDDYALPCEDTVECVACFQCANEDPCKRESDKCDHDADCRAYFACITADGCSGTTCDSACQTQHPSGAQIWDDLFQCGEALCTDQCS